MEASRRVSLGRIIAQGLVPATAARSPLDAVENLAALQGQQASAIPWAIGVRCAGVSRARVEESFARGELVRSWPMRGTVHVTSARDHHWLRRLLRQHSHLRPLRLFTRRDRLDRAQLPIPRTEIVNQIRIDARQEDARSREQLGRQLFTQDRAHRALSDAHDVAGDPRAPERTVERRLEGQGLHHGRAHAMQLCVHNPPGRRRIQLDDVGRIGGI